MSIHCTKCGNECWGTFLKHRISTGSYRTRLSITEFSMVMLDVYEIVECGNCGHIMLYTQNEKFIRNLK